MQPPSEHVHWLFATGVLLLALLLLAEAIVGSEVWRRRKWRAYLWPSILFGLGVVMWPVMVLFTNSCVVLSVFVHHICGWLLLIGALFPLGAAFKPRSLVYNAGYALVIVGVAVALYTSRDVAPVFGHLSPSAGVAHR